MQDVTSIGATDTARWYHHDQLGTTRLLTDITGNPIGTATYNPNGTPASITGATTHIAWAGEYHDTETGYTYLRARYYDPATSQFLTRDPLEFVSRQPYAYANNDPINTTDPTGLLFGIDKVVAGAVGAVVGGGVSMATQAVTKGRVDWGDVGRDAVAGAVGGAVGASCPWCAAAAASSTAEFLHSRADNRAFDWRTAGISDGVGTAGSALLRPVFRAETHPLWGTTSPALIRPNSLFGIGLRVGVGISAHSFTEWLLTGRSPESDLALASQDAWC